ncbi:MAG: DNA alkylation repair protein [Salibacteraceae bacterium]
MKSAADVIAHLKAIADPQKLSYKAEKYDIQTSNALGIYHSDLKEMAKQIGKNSELALELWDSGIYEARLITSKIFRPKDLTMELAVKWTLEFDTWEICDSFSMAVFGKSPLAIEIIRVFRTHEMEFVKRSSFATMASYGLADKQAENMVFETFFTWIEEASTDERNFVKKAVNWALRTIGKRNVDLRDRAIQVSNKLLASQSKSAQWIASDAIKELTKPNVKMQDHPRSIYRL